MRSPGSGRRPLRHLALALVALALALSGLAVVRAARVASRQPDVPPADPPALDADALARDLGALVRRRTVSWDAGGADDDEWRGVYDLLAERFPGAHAVLAAEAFGASRLFTWTGSEPDLAPLLLLAHLDVVPAADEAAWTRAPFGGEVAQGFVWGRGALDDKGSVCAIFAAIEHLAARGFRPRRSLLVALGHDEERGGLQGAARIATALAQRGLRPWFVLDEGGQVVAGIVPGIDRPVAVIGIAEKGMLTLRLRARGAGGHSSMPPATTAVGRIARAVARLEASPFPARLDGATREHLAYLAPELPFARRLVLANPWLFRPLIERSLLAAPSTAAMVRTTLAATMVSGGVKENVLPAEADAVLNLRLLPGDTAAEARSRVVRVIDDEGIEVEVTGSPTEASPIAPVDSRAFRLLQRTIRAVFPEVVTAPYLVVGATDARHYAGLTDAVYRFLPFTLGPEDLERLHGVDERVAVSDLARAAGFYVELLREALAAGP